MSETAERANSLYSLNGQWYDILPPKSEPAVVLVSVFTTRLQHRAHVSEREMKTLYGNLKPLSISLDSNYFEIV